MRLEEIGLEADRALVQRLRLGELVAAVVDVREVDQRRHEIRIELERLPIGGRRLLELRLVAIVERRAGAEVFLGERRVSDGNRPALDPERRGGRLRRDRSAAGRRSVRIFAGAASSRKSNASCP